MLLLKTSTNLCTLFIYIYIYMWDSVCICVKKGENVCTTLKKWRKKNTRKRERTRGFHFNANANTQHQTHIHKIVYSTIRKWVQWHEKLRSSTKIFFLPAIIIWRHIILHTLRLHLYWSGYMCVLRVCGMYEFVKYGIQ